MGSNVLTGFFNNTSKWFLERRLNISLTKSYAVIFLKRNPTPSEEFKTTDFIKYNQNLFIAKADKRNLTVIMTRLQNFFVTETKRKNMKKPAASRRACREIFVPGFFFFFFLFFKPGSHQSVARTNIYSKPELESCVMIFPLLAFGFTIDE